MSEGIESNTETSDPSLLYGDISLDAAVLFAKKRKARASKACLKSKMVSKKGGHVTESDETLREWRRTSPARSWHRRSGSARSGRADDTDHSMVIAAVVVSVLCSTASVVVYDRFFAQKVVTARSRSSSSTSGTSIFGQDRRGAVRGQPEPLRRPREKPAEEQCRHTGGGRCCQW